MTVEKNSEAEYFKQETQMLKGHVFIISLVSCRLLLCTSVEFKTILRFFSVKSKLTVTRFAP